MRVGRCDHGCHRCQVSTVNLELVGYVFEHFKTSFQGAHTIQQVTVKHLDGKTVVKIGADAQNRKYQSTHE